MVGEDDLLGNWDVSKGVALETSDATYPIWHCSRQLRFPSGSYMVFKFAVVDECRRLVKWEELPAN